MFNLKDLSEHGNQSVSEQEIVESVIGLEDNEVNLINFKFLVLLLLFLDYWRNLR